MEINERISMYWEPDGSSSVRCLLCPHRCSIAEGSAGFCGVRENRGASLYSAGYGLISSIALDPIEKKPLYMFRPGTKILSIGGFGCNLRCPFCQNHEISMVYDYGKEPSEDTYVEPEYVLSLAKRSIAQGNIGIAYTYNEPFINYEYMLECAKLAHGAGLLNIAVTNGYVSQDPLLKALPFLDAMNIDLKGFTPEFYKNIAGKLEHVLNTISLVSKQCHIEVTTLVIPGENEDDITELAKWLSSLDPDIPLHLSRFFPRYHYSEREPTPRETIHRLSDTAKEYLNNVFAGNM